MVNEIVYSTNEIENAIDYIEKAAEFFNNKNDKHRFKWLMISLHGALYSFGLCNIKGTNSTERIFKKIKKSDLDKFTEQIKKSDTLVVYGDQSDSSFRKYAIFTRGKILDINTVLERCKQEKYMMQFTESKILSTSDVQDEAIKKVTSYRNDFMHFKPTAYGIVGDFENDNILPVLQVIEFLALETFNVFYRQDTDKYRVRNALEGFTITQR